MGGRIMPRILLLCSLLMTWPGPSLPADDNARMKPGSTVILVSIDGFRWDFPDLFDTPNIDRIIEQGGRAESTQPVYPTLTFPNHYSIATGVWPRKHGIVANAFPSEDRTRWYRDKDRASVEDGRWYLAEPIWVTAEKQGLKTAAFYFVGTEADINGVRPSFWRRFDPDVPAEARVEQVLEWLKLPAGERPRFVTLYFEHVDQYTHWYGIGSAESQQAISHIDALIGRLLDGIGETDVSGNTHVLLVSDHGQYALDKASPTLVLDTLVDLGDFEAVDSGAFVNLWMRAPERDRLEAVRDTINRHWICGKAMLREELPSAWNVSDSLRFPDIVVQANGGCSVISTQDKQQKATPGDHGWPPEVKEMRGIFLAIGPRIRPGASAGHIHVTDIYPLMLELLQLDPPAPYDGDSEALRVILKDP